MNTLNLSILYSNMKYMRKLFYLFLIPVLFSCNNSNRIDNTYMDEYRYPMDSLINPKVFVFQRTDSIEKLTFYYEQMKVVGNNRIFIYTRLNHDNNSQYRDSIVYYYQQKNLIIKDKYILVRDFKTNSDKLSKCEILEYTDHLNKRVIKSKCSFPLNESINSTFYNVSTFDKKITFKLFNRDVECLKMNDLVQVRGYHKYIPFVGKKIEMTGYTILAKGIGMVYASITDKESKKNYTYQLKEIIDYSTYHIKYPIPTADRDL